MLSALIIGLGDIGLGYDLNNRPECVFTHTKACMIHPGIELIGGVDPSPERREEFQSYTGVQAYSDLDSVEIQASGVDIIIISTPTDIRKQVVQKSLVLKPKAILLEKPIADSVEEGSEIIEMCRENNVVLVINYFRRFDKSIKHVKQAIEQNRYGRIRQAVCCYSGGLLNNASHYIDLFRFWFGEAESVKRLSPKVRQADGDKGLSFLLNYDSFTACFIHSPANYDVGEIDLLFDYGRIRFENFCEDISFYEVKQDPFFPNHERLLESQAEVEQTKLARYQYDVLDAVYSGLKNGTAIESSGDSALRTLQLCLEVLNEK